jgi:uncharacterized protein with HEPN domain
MDRNQSYLLDVYQAALEARQCVEGMDAEAFEADRKTQLAVLYCITILGEAVKRLSPEFRAEYSAVAWRQIAGMRDKLIHDYRQVNVSMVWRVLQGDIVELMDAIQPLLPERK